MKRIDAASGAIKSICVILALLLAIPAGAPTLAGQDTRETLPTVFDGMPEQIRAASARGRRLFDLRFLPTPADNFPGGGLGPLYMRSSCMACHANGGRGVLPGSVGAASSGGVVYLAVPHAAYGGEIQNRSVPGVPHEADISVRWETDSGAFLDGEQFSLRAPIVSLERNNYGPVPDTLSVRIGPPLAGLGLLESVPGVDILSWVDTDDLNGDGISGRPNIVPDLETGGRALGRFGWKAGSTSLRWQIAVALRDFMGLTSPLLPLEPCAPAQLECLSQASIGRPDVPDGMLRDLTAFVSSLQAPARRDANDPAVLQGQTLFRQVGCGGCHRERLTTAAAIPGAPFLAGLDIFPYTDLLLHDMGDELDDGRREGGAATWEWRTPPLWGLGRALAVPGSPGLLHDGRARTVTEAILWHGGEARRARDAFFVLSRIERDALIAFLNSL